MLNWNEMDEFIHKTPSWYKPKERCQMWYTVEVNTFDWDADHYRSEWREYTFSDADKANAFYDTITNLDYNEEMLGRPCVYIHWRENEELSELMNIEHGGIFKESARMYRITREKVK